LIDLLIDTAVCVCVCVCAIRAYNSKIKLRTQNAKLNVTQRLCTASATFAVLKGQQFRGQRSRGLTKVRAIRHETCHNWWMDWSYSSRMVVTLYQLH